MFSRSCAIITLIGLNLFTGYCNQKDEATDDCGDDLSCFVQHSVKSGRAQLNTSSELLQDHAGQKVEKSPEIGGVSPATQVSEDEEVNFLDDGVAVVNWLAKYMGAHPEMPSHAFPSWEFNAVHYPAILYCCITLFVAGFVCSAGGIGGGGVYVTVLLVAGQLVPHDAVPLSKSIVFFGSLSSLVLNLMKTVMGKSSINFDICRIVVPFALFGTLMGVLLNSLIAAWLIVALLALILIVTAAMSIHKFLESYQQERLNALAAGNQSNSHYPDNQSHAQDPKARMAHDVKKDEVHDIAPMAGQMYSGEGFGAFLLLVFTVFCGVVRGHTINCQNDILTDVTNQYGRARCMRPVMQIFFGPNFASYAQPGTISSSLLLWSTVFVPACVIITISVKYAGLMLKYEGWTHRELVGYSSMAVFTGCFAGLVGIGGGLIFAPFILWMNVEPTIAIATSSTLVIFTSSSTTFQYMLTDRIIMSLTLVYGIINLVASYLGTKAVWAITEYYPKNKSMLNAIVCVGVIASVILSVYKLCTMGVAH